MNTFARLILQAIGNGLANLLDRLSPNVKLHAEIHRLRRTVAAEQRRGDALAAELAQTRATLKETELELAMLSDDYDYQLAELHGQLDDGDRAMQQARTSISHHVREHVQLTTQVDWLTKRNAYLESCLRHRNAVMTGILLVGQVQPEQVSAP